MFFSFLILFLIFLVLNFLVLIPFQICTESAEITETFKCLKDIRLPEGKLTEGFLAQHYIFVTGMGRAGWYEGS